ncbi:MAG: acetyl/propionyl/methylcrotonyl-CoA carboxylase subunit alpha [Rhodospirillales bacterium]
MFSSILIANRGEIACRVMRTARKLGLRTIAVYSEADANALHVREADEAVLIGPAPARESYLVIEKIIAAAKETGAEAIHPGYGFLSENAAFARACEEAGIVFVGPPASAIDAMGSKSAVKSLMAKAGVPLVPGYHGDDKSIATLASAVRDIGFPVLIKATAGGGGKGMRRVDREEDVETELAAAQREALSSFGDAKVLVERLLERPRHVEVQVFADAHGHCVHLFERDCSIQRRHQKVVEEAPAPGVTPELRAEIGAAAVAAAVAIGYVGAGTVEFLMDEDGSFYFMEMNTRLQVEHPVTELISGLDLVELQLRVAAGEELPVGQDDLVPNGHAIEVRLYAEDPAGGFLPATGTLSHLRYPAQSGNIRVDGGVAEGDEVGVHYDPMISKIIVWDRDRPSAVRRLRAALDATEVAGLRTNRDFLRAIAYHPAFAAAELDTGFIARHETALFAEPALDLDEALALASLHVLLTRKAETERRAAASADPYSPWNMATGWRLNDRKRMALEFRMGDDIERVEVAYGDQGYRMTTLTSALDISGSLTGDGRIEAVIGGTRICAGMAEDAGVLTLFIRGEAIRLALIDPAHAGEEEGVSEGGLVAPMPGKIIAVHVAAGEAVEAGQALVVMEAMKMEHTIRAPEAGLVREVFFTAGDQVPDGAELLALAKGEG